MQIKMWPYLKDFWEANEHIWQGSSMYFYARTEKAANYTPEAWAVTFKSAYCHHCSITNTKTYMLLN